jgi:hypothetical protein
LNELDVVFPERGWNLLGQVAAQQVATFAPIGIAKLGAVNSKTEVNFRFLRLDLPGLGNFKSINPKTRPASFLASPILIRNALAAEFHFLKLAKSIPEFPQTSLAHGPFFANAILTLSLHVKFAFMGEQLDFDSRTHLFPGTGYTACE